MINSTNLLTPYINKQQVNKPVESVVTVPHSSSSNLLEKFLNNTASINAPTVNKIQTPNTVENKPYKNDLITQILISIIFLKSPNFDFKSFKSLSNLSDMELPSELNKVPKSSC